MQNTFRHISQKPPRALRVWLHDRSSLTRRLQTLSNNQFSVTVLKQRWEKPRRAEAQLLNLPLHEVALIREVILHGNSTPWVYARSILPLRTLNGSLRFLRHWDNRPLGALLFRNPRIQREQPIVQQIACDTLPIALQTTAMPSKPWGRSSVFRHGTHGLLVSETFLPALVDVIMCSSYSTPSP
ncbi:MAG: chorismate lyase [Cellvibrionales bacterium]|jgi:chorismate--pyruvate lyase|nr:chorismate lyase [Cellvibrionales bacterium]